MASPQSGRSRWSGLDQQNQNNVPITGQLVSDTGTGFGAPSSGSNVRVVPIGTGGYLRREDDGPNSDYYRCYYAGTEEPLL